MNLNELSDLEEGEILEYEFGPAKNTSKTKNESISKSCENFVPDAEHKNVKCSQKKFGKELNNVLNANDLESISSSDGEYKSGEEICSLYYSDEKNTLSDESTNKNYFKRKCFSRSAYGTAEDILSEIGETLRRKSKCNFKRQKSRDGKYKCNRLHKNKSKSCNIWSQNVYSNQMLESKSQQKKKKRKKIGDESHADVHEENIDLQTLRRMRLRIKRNKKKAFNLNTNKISSREKGSQLTSKKSRDFDEVRKALLEKLKKEKEEEKLTKTFEKHIECLETKDLNITLGNAKCTGNLLQVIERQKCKEAEIALVKNDTSEIICSKKNYNDLDENFNNNNNTGDDNDDDDEETNLVKLRLMALASNKKKETSKNLAIKDLSEVKENSCHSALDFYQEKNENNLGFDKNVKDSDFDRNELLLRAEALKTALIKKHLKRKLNKIDKNKYDIGQEHQTSRVIHNDFYQDLTLKEEKKNSVSSSNQEPYLVVSEENIKEKKEKPKFTEDPVSNVDKSCMDLENENENETSYTQVKKRIAMPRNKKKKKKSECLSISINENDKNEIIEEDDGILRSQLLNDLMMRKSVKNSSTRSALLESVQTLDSKATEAKQEPLSLSKIKNSLAFNPRKTINPRVIPKIPKPEIQRIIVHLGSEDSSDDEGNPRLDSPTPSKTEVDEGEESRNKSAGNDANKVNYEKSVELLLSQARRKVEKESRDVKRNFMATPEAVYKHLPLSKRMEYIRLKQKIAEKEKQIFQCKNLKGFFSRDKEQGFSENEIRKGTRPAQQNGTETDSKGEHSSLGLTLEPRKPVGSFTFPSANENRKRLSRTLENSVADQSSVPKFRSVSEGISNEKSPMLRTCRKYISPANVKTVNLKTENQKLAFAPSLQSLIPRLKLMLKKIKIEKNLEENYEREIAKLKSQLNLFERKKSEQKIKIKKLAEDSMKIYKTLQKMKISDRQQPPPLPPPPPEPLNFQNEENVEPDGSKPKDVPEPGLTKKKKEAEGSGPGTTSSIEFLHYESPLQVFKGASTTTQSVQLDPNAILCQFDLLGMCKDEECCYQHLRAS